MTNLIAPKPDIDIIGVLADRGYRPTGPRRAIVQALEGKGEGFTAEDVVAELPGVGRATVFRTLKLLLEVGLICKLNLVDGAPRYSLARKEHHHHVVCVSCGCIGEFRAGTIERVMRALDGDIPGGIIGHRIEVYVTCNRCLGKEAA